MDGIHLNYLVCNGKPAELKVCQTEIVVLIDQKNFTIQKSIIKNMEVFRGIKNFCLRLSYEDEKLFVLDFHNISESNLGKLRQFVSQAYDISLNIQDLESINTTEGNLIYNNDILLLKSSKQILSIPKTAIKNIIEVENDVQLDLGSVEIVLSTNSNISQLIDGKASIETCIINGVASQNPRCRATLVFFGNHLVMKGPSYDHSIFYDNIIELFYLKHDNSFYLVLVLDKEIAQGQTIYSSIVFLLNDKIMEVVSTDTRLKSFYSGPQHEIILDIFESLLKIKAQESDLFVKCTSKVFDGHLYFLENTLLFLPKSISISNDEITHVEFSRINLSKYQARSFDMTINGEKVYNFNGINKESFGLIESYFNKRNIKMVSEIIEDSISDESSGSYDESGDLSDIIGSDE